MSDLERRAMLGDQQAQEECTRQGIAIPCWRCGGSAEVRRLNSEGKPIYAVVCKRSYCGAYGSTCPTLQKAIAYWNRRPAPPIGRCKDCAHKQKAKVNDKGFLVCPASGMEITDDDFCGYFEEVPDEAAHIHRD